MPEQPKIHDPILLTDRDGSLPDSGEASRNLFISDFVQSALKENTTRTSASNPHRLQDSTAEETSAGSSMTSILPLLTVIGAEAAEGNVSVKAAEGNVSVKAAEGNVSVKAAETNVSDKAAETNVSDNVEFRETREGNDGSEQTLAERIKQRGEQLTELEKKQNRTAEDNARLRELRNEQARDTITARRRIKALSAELGAVEDPSTLSGDQERDYKAKEAEWRQLKVQTAKEIERAVQVSRDTAPRATDPGGITGRGSGTGGDATQGRIFKICNDHLRRLGYDNLVLVPMRSDTAVDGVGGDFVLMNKTTGEWIPVDATQRDKRETGLPDLRGKYVIDSDPHNRDGRYDPTPTDYRNYPDKDRAEIIEIKRKRDIEQQFDQMARDLERNGSPLNVVETPPPNVELPESGSPLSRLGHKERMAEIDAMGDPAKRLREIQAFQADIRPKLQELETFLQQCRDRAASLREDPKTRARANVLDAFVDHSERLGDKAHLDRLSRRLEASERRARAQLAPPTPPVERPAERPVDEAKERRRRDGRDLSERAPTSISPEGLRLTETTLARFAAGKHSAEDLKGMRDQIAELKEIREALRKRSASTTEINAHITTFETFVDDLEGKNGVEPQTKAKAELARRAVEAQADPTRVRGVHERAGVDTVVRENRGEGRDAERGRENKAGGRLAGVLILSSLVIGAYVGVEAMREQGRPGLPTPSRPY